MRDGWVLIETDGSKVDARREPKGYQTPMEEVNFAYRQQQTTWRQNELEEGLPCVIQEKPE